MRKASAVRPELSLIPISPLSACPPPLQVGLNEPRNLSLDDALEYINEDEMVEVSATKHGLGHAGGEWTAADCKHKFRADAQTSALCLILALRLRRERHVSPP